jgi:hypothetical protein
MIWFGTIVGFICAVAATVAYDQGNVGLSVALCLIGVVSLGVSE